VLFCSISGERRVKKGRCSARMKEDKDKEVKRLNFPFCNRKLLERLKFECLEVCINMHFEVRTRGLDLSWPIVIETFFLLKINTKQSEDS
jgi:hypothetical protein